MGTRPCPTASTHRPQPPRDTPSVYWQASSYSLSDIIFLVATVPGSTRTVLRDTLANFTLYVYDRRAKGTTLSAPWQLYFHRNQRPSHCKVVKSPRRFFSTEWSDNNPTAIAKQIVKTSDSLRLSGIQYLDESLARYLVRHSGRTLYLDNLYHIDLEVLEILISHAGRGLSLGGLKDFSIQEASVLARYPGRLSLNNVTNLNSETLATLVEHTGKSISFGSLDTLTQLQTSQLKKYRGDLYLRGIPELPPGVDSEFIEFPGKIVLMHHERRPIQTYASGDAPAEDLAARIALGIVTFACMAALFALLMAVLSNF